MTNAEPLDDNPSSRFAYPAGIFQSVELIDRLKRSDADYAIGLFNLKAMNRMLTHEFESNQQKH